MDQNYSKNVVLVIDDEYDCLKFVSDILQLQQIETSMADTGEDGIKLAMKTIPDLILLDVKMPGMDGFETCLKLKSNYILRETPVIFMTGLSDIDSKLKAFNAGGVDYVTKPFRRPELLARVCVHLRIKNLQKDLEIKNEKLEGAIETSRAVNIAIGVLMHRDKITKEEAYEKIRTEARSVRKKVKEISQEILNSLTQPA
jgi:DNA-binding response OmpR family regulator